MYEHEEAYEWVDQRIAALEAEVERLRGELDRIATMAAQDNLLEVGGLHTNRILMAARAALAPKEDADEMSKV